MTQDPRSSEEAVSDETEAVTSEAPAGGGEEISTIPDDAFYSPDDPIALSEGDIPEDAIFSPDDPLTRSEGGEGVVTGIGGSAARSPQRGMGLAWEIRHTADLLKALERDLREHGMEALRIRPETEPMDAMLRSFIAGFLVGRLEEEE